MKKDIIVSKLTSLVLCAVIALSGFFIGNLSVQAAITADTSWYDASKSEFTITTAEQLAGWSQLASDGGGKVYFEGKTIKLGANITLNTGDAKTWGTTAPANVWTPIARFHGTFDGQGHTISGLYVKQTESGKHAALIATVVSPNKENPINVVVKNAAILNSYFEAAGGNTAAGSFVASLHDCIGTFSDLYSDATVRGFFQSGGIVGRTMRTSSNPRTNPVSSSYERCAFAGSVITTDEDFAGGILGFTHNQEATFTDCINYGSITNAINKRVGGITSRAGANTTFTRCVNTGKLTSEKIDQKGGIVGNLSRDSNSPPKPEAVTITLSNCYYLATEIISKHIGNPNSAHDFTLVDDTKSIEESSELIGTNAITTLAGFDFSDTWMAVEGNYPIPKLLGQMIGATVATTGGDSVTEADTTADAATTKLPPTGTTVAPSTSDFVLIFTAFAFAAALISLNVISRKKKETK